MVYKKSKVDFFISTMLDLFIRYLLNEDEYLIESFTKSIASLRDDTRVIKNQILDAIVGVTANHEIRAKAVKRKTIVNHEIKTNTAKQSFIKILLSHGAEIERYMLLNAFECIRDESMDVKDNVIFSHLY